MHNNKASKKKNKTEEIMLTSQFTYKLQNLQESCLYLIKRYLIFQVKASFIKAILIYIMFLTNGLMHAEIC